MLKNWTGRHFLVKPELLGISFTQKLQVFEKNHKFLMSVSTRSIQYSYFNFTILFSETSWETNSVATLISPFFILKLQASLTAIYFWCLQTPAPLLLQFHYFLLKTPGFLESRKFLMSANTSSIAALISEFYFRKHGKTIKLTIFTRKLQVSSKAISFWWLRTPAPLLLKFHHFYSLLCKL